MKIHDTAQLTVKGGNRAEAIAKAHAALVSYFGDDLYTITRFDATRERYAVRNAQGDLVYDTTWWEVDVKAQRTP